MKQIKSKAYMVVSSAYLGVSEDIAKIFARAAEYYQAEVFHLGGTISDKEAKVYNRHRDRVETAQSQLTYAELQLEDARESQDKAEIKKAASLVEKLTYKAESAKTFLDSVVHAERERINTLLDAFGTITAVTAPGDSDFPTLHTEELSNIPGVKTKESGVALSRYMYLSAVMPSSERTTAKPITKRAIDYLKQYGKFSWVVAHPVPAVATMEKLGLNNAHKFYTVGSMRHTIAPRGHRQFFRGAHLPCAILILIDPKSGEYHAKPMHIDYIPFRGGKRPCVLDDGLVFFADKVIEVGSEDRGSMFTDDHAPYTHPGTLAAERALNVLHQPAWLINAGDAADFSSISPHTLEAPGERENLRLEEDLTALRALLDAQANVKSIKHKVLIDSNHHEWVTRFVASNPALKKTLDWHTLAEKRFSDWDVFIRDGGDNRLFHFGDYLIRHGDKESIEVGSRMTESGKYACGHHHRYYTFMRAVSIGCGAGLGPKYIGNQVTAWLAQMASLTKYKGVASINPKIVLHDTKRQVARFAYRDAIYEVDFYNLFDVKLKMGKKQRGSK